MNEYTFRWDNDRGVLWAGERSYPARFINETWNPDHPRLRMETRHAYVHFENRWQLSITWGTATYSSNAGWVYPYRPGEFIEEPTLVEVGVLPPPDGLWNDPLGYVSVPEFHRAADLVMMLPSDCDLPDGEWEGVDGFCDLLIAAGLETTL